MPDEPLYLDMPPPSDQRIDMLHVWIATHADGSEGIASADFVLPEGIRHIPLMASKRSVAEALEPKATQIRRAAMHQTNRVVSVRLVTYRKVDEPPAAR